MQYLWVFHSIGNKRQEDNNPPSTLLPLFRITFNFTVIVSLFIELLTYHFFWFVFCIHFSSKITRNGFNLYFYNIFLLQSYRNSQSHKEQIADTRANKKLHRFSLTFERVFILFSKSAVKRENLIAGKLQKGKSPKFFF